MKLPQLQPNITIKIPFQDVFIDITLQNNTSIVDCFNKLQLNSTGTPFHQLAATKPPA
jgi:hypothetical protein